MSPIRARRSVAGTKNVTLLAALVAVALTATPLVLSASGARATSEAPAEATLRVAPVEVAPVAAPKVEPCLRKVRVVYGGYGTPEGCAAR